MNTSIDWTFDISARGFGLWVKRIYFVSRIPSDPWTIKLSDVSRSAYTFVGYYAVTQTKGLRSNKDICIINFARRRNYSI